ncbi:nQR2 and RnfD family protein [Clostridium sp. CAG:413]|nr:nQR2 and RnfD family protein [Clostridium sp. CAG:413]
MAENAVKQNKVKNSRIFGDYLIMLVAPLVIAVWYYGARAVYAAAAAVAGAMITDIAANLIIRKQYRLKDLSSVYIGAAIAAMMPAGIPLYIPAMAAAFAVLAVKIPFGGGLRAPFSPVAAGFAFACVCFKEQIFDYSYNSVDKLLGSASLGSLLAKGNSVRLNSVNLFDIVSGNVAGPMATGCGIVLIACCAYLFVRRRKALLATAGFIVTCAVFAAVFPRINASAITSVVLELSSGSLIFAGVSLLTDLATLSKSSAVSDSAEEQRREGDIRGGLRRYLHDDAPPGRL